MPEPDDYEWDGPPLTDAEDEMLRGLMRSQHEKLKLERWFRIALLLFGIGIAAFLLAMILVIVRGVR